MDDGSGEIILTENEGAIIIREGAKPEIYTPISVGDEPDNIRFTLAFLLYAVERDDWVEEFSGFVDKLNSQKDEAMVSVRRSNFEVIDGDKE